MNEQPVRDRVYSTGVSDSTRWDGFRFRDGDIIVCTGPKCGTTWTQMLCALLVHGGPDFPEPLAKLTRWLDRHTIPIETLVTELDAQPWRRIIKTHTPLDGLPYDPRAKYVICGRDPRDAFLSFLDHVQNVSEASAREARRRAGVPEDMELPSDPNVLFPLWATSGVQPWVGDGAPFGLPVVYFYQTFWRFRQLPNLHFTHYADLQRDLASETRRLARFLEIDTSRLDLPRIIHAASFDAMRSDADHTAPGADLGEWRCNRDFFRAARLGAWRDVLTAENQALYEQTNSKRLDRALERWLENGGGF
jgi:aryl sulfotransferase